MSAQVRDELRCGECGGRKFTLCSLADAKQGRYGGGAVFHGQVLAKCEKCGKESAIAGVAVKASLQVDDEGSLCGGWSGGGK